MSKGNNVAKGWDEAAASWVDFVRHGKDYFRDELNNPAMFKLIGDVRGKVVLDIGCGEGYNARILAHKGAKVLAADLSGVLIEYAKAQEEKDGLGIDYFVADSVDLSMFPDSHFDVVTCFMALMDIEKYGAAIGEIARVMKATGRFLFSITHPCFEYNPETKKIEGKTEYFGVKRETVPGSMERLLTQFEIVSYHRTLTDYSKVLFDHGLLIRRLIEPLPTRAGLAKFAPLRQVQVTPHSVVFETVKAIASLTP